MAFYIYSAPWFSGIDSLFEIITLITSFVISIYSYKIYKVFNLVKYKYFSITFLLLGISFIAKIISNLIFIVPKKREISFHLYTLIYTTYDHYLIINDISFFVYKISLLLGLLILFFIISNQTNRENIILTLFFAFILGFLIENYLLFNFIIIIILVYLFILKLIKDLRAIKKSEKNLKNVIYKISNLTYFFLGLSLSYFFLFLAKIDSSFYFCSEVILLITFTFILINFMRIFKK